MSNFKNIAPFELQNMQAQGVLQLVDVRNDDELARGIIPDATHIALHLLPMRWNELSEDIPLVFYCHSGVRSVHACEYLKQQGFDQLYNLQGGVLAWAHAGLAFVPKTKDSPHGV